jgi:hypothetical protein
MRTSATQYRVERTNETVSVRLDEFSAPIQLPVVRIAKLFEVSELDSFDGVCDLDGEYFYLTGCHHGDLGESAKWTLPNGQIWNQDFPQFLHKEILNFFGDGNDVFTYEVRQAPASSLGICAYPRGSLFGLSEPLFVVKPNLAKIQEEIETKARNLAEADRLIQAANQAESEWEEAFRASAAAQAATGRFYDLPERAVVGEKYWLMDQAQKAATEFCRKAGIRVDGR